MYLELRIENRGSKIAHSIFDLRSPIFGLRCAAQRPVIERGRIQSIVDLTGDILAEDRAVEGIGYPQSGRIILGNNVLELFPDRRLLSRVGLDQTLVDQLIHALVRIEPGVGAVGAGGRAMIENPRP